MASAKVRSPVLRAKRAVDIQNIGVRSAAELVEPQGGTLCYERHRPGQTPLYRIIAQHDPAFVEHMAGRGRPLPDCVRQEFESYLKCGHLEHGFLRVRCYSGRAGHLVAFSCKQCGICPRLLRTAHGRDRRAALR